MVKALGLSNPQKVIPFSDVNAGKWYYDVVTTAYDYGIINGYSDGTFRPDGKITREEAMVMVANAMKLTELESAVSELEITKQLNVFTDGNTVANWAKQSVAASIRNGMVNGYNGMISAKTNVTRAETVVMLRRLLQKADLI